MRIYYDGEKSSEITSRIEKKFLDNNRERGEELHVSDLCICLMKPYCRLNGFKPKSTKQNIGMMVFGIITENLIASTYPLDELQYAVNLYLGTETIAGHIDIFEDKVFPLEIKSTRKRIFKANMIPKSWIEQIMSYLAFQGKHKGWIVIFNIFSTQIMAFCVEMTDTDILDWLVTLTLRTSVVRRKDPKDIPINPEEYEFCDYKSNCPKRLECYNAWLKLKGK